MTDFLMLAFVFLVAGVVAVPVASRLGLGSVLGYLIAGIAISPLLRALGVDLAEVQHFAEFGVVMMLFLVGLELEPKLLWEMRARLLGLGGLQVLVTAAVVTGAAIALGQPLTVGLAIGLILSLSSTAIVLQTLNEKALLKSDGGQSSFAVLLFQDIAVIPMLALIPLLALPGLKATTAEAQASFSLVAGLNGWQTALVTLAAIAAVGLGGAYLTRPVFRFIAVARLRELFTATALMFVVGIALLMSLVGLSPALGTFLAGVVLANSEYRHELESDIDPFRGLLLGLFFMTVGAGINFGLLFENFGSILGLTLGLMAIKTIVLLGLARAFKLTEGDKWLFGLGLAQAGEFGFVLLSFTVANAVLPAAIADKLSLVVALSMMLTPILFILYDRVILPRYDLDQEREADDIEPGGQVIIAGHGRFGGIVNQMLRSVGYKTTALDYSAAQLDMLRSYGLRAFFGDATRPDLLHAAGIAEAKVLVVALDEREPATELVRYVRANYPHVHIVARAKDRTHVYELWAAGCRDIIRETFDSSVRTGRSVYEALGVHPFEAEQMARAFVLEDRAAMRELAGLYDANVPHNENIPYRERAKEIIAQRGAQMAGRSNAFLMRVDRGWSPPTPKDVAEAQEQA